MPSSHPDRKVVVLPETEGRRLQEELSSATEESAELCQHIRLLLKAPLLDESQRTQLLSRLSELREHLLAREKRTASSSIAPQTKQELIGSLQDHIKDLRDHIDDLTLERDALRDLKSVHADQLEKLQGALTKKEDELARLQRLQRSVESGAQKRSVTRLFDDPAESIKEPVRAASIRPRSNGAHLSRAQQIATIEEDLPHFRRRVQEWKSNPRFQDLDQRFAAKQQKIDRKQQQLSELEASLQKIEKTADGEIEKAVPTDLMRAIKEAIANVSEPQQLTLDNLQQLANSVLRRTQEALGVSEGFGSQSIDEVNQLRAAAAAAERTVIEAEQIAREAIAGSRTALENARRHFKEIEAGHEKDKQQLHKEGNKKLQESEQERDQERRKRREAEIDRENERRRRQQAESERDEAERKRQQAEAARENDRHNHRTFLREQEELQRELGAFRTALRDLEGQLHQAQRAQQEAERKLRQDQEQSSTKNTVERVLFQSQIDRERQLVADLRNQLNRAHQQGQDLQRSSQELQAGLNQRNAEVLSLRTQLAEAKTMLQQAGFEKERFLRENDDLRWKTRNPSPPTGNQEGLSALIMLLADKLNMLPKELERSLMARNGKRDLDKALQEAEESMRSLNDQNQQLMRDLQAFLKNLQELQERIEGLEADNEALSERVEELESENAALAYQLASSEEVRISLSADLSDEQQQRRSAEASNTTLEEEIKRLRARIEDLTATNSALRAEVAQEQGRAASAEQRAKEAEQDAEEARSRATAAEQAAQKESIRADRAISERQKTKQQRDGERADFAQGARDLRELYLTERAARIAAEQERDHERSTREHISSEKKAWEGERKGYKGLIQELQAKVVSLEASLHDAQKALKVLHKRHSSNQRRQKKEAEDLQSTIEKLESDLKIAYQALTQAQERSQPAQRSTIIRYRTKVEERQREVIPLRHRLRQALLYVKTFELTVGQTIRLLGHMIREPQIIQMLVDQRNANRNGSAQTISALLKQQGSGEAFLSALLSVDIDEHLSVSPESIAEKTLRALITLKQDKVSHQPQSLRQRVFGKPAQSTPLSEVLESSLTRPETQELYRMFQQHIHFQIIKSYVISSYQRRYPQGLERDELTGGYRFYPEITGWFQAGQGSDMGHDLTKRYLDQHPEALQQVLDLFVSSSAALPEGVQELVNS